MAILDLFSNRQKRERGEVPDVFVYDQLPERLRVQITYLVSDALGEPFFEGHVSRAYEVYQSIVDALCRHFGRLTLAGGDEPHERLKNFLIVEQSVPDCLDAIELSFRVVEKLDTFYTYPNRPQVNLEARQAIAELNHRFREHGVGYQYVSGKIIRADSQYLHAEVIKPTLALLQDKRYHGANDEFLKAHEHYRHGEIKDCLADCLNALESTLKTICTLRKWQFQPTDTAKTLLEVCFKAGLVPDFWQSHFAALRSTLESGVPTVRNKLGGHGQGPQVVDVPPHFAAYALHMTGSAIQFLIEAEKALS